MADTRPFRAFYYNTERAGDLTRLVCPPYDLIDEAKRRELKDRSPYNFVRLELPESTDPNYADIARMLHQWEKQRVLIEDNVKAFYLLRHDFEVDGEKLSRLGVFSAVRLEEFGKGGVYPHEVTFSAAKEERFKQLSALKTNTSPIFAFFPDPNAEIFRMMKKAAFGSTMMEAEYEDGQKLTVYAIRERVMQDKLTAAFEKRRLFIADGHHRYETALRYSQMHGGGYENPAGYVMMYLVSAQDPGIRILPTHRLLRQWPEGMTAQSFVESAAMYFDVTELQFDEVTSERAAYHLDKEAYRPSFCFYSAEKPETLYVFKVQQPWIDRHAQEIEDPELASLDVNILSKFVFQELIRLKPEDLDDVIVYDHGLESTLERVGEGEAVGAFLMRPTSMETVVSLARRLVKMPPKSTYFYPKAPSGVVTRKL